MRVAIRSLWAAVGVAVVMAMSAVAAWAQPTTGLIDGTVRYDAAQVVVDVQVTAIAATGAHYSTVTDSLGHFAFPGLPAGQYTIRIGDWSAFQPVERTVVVAPDTMIGLEIRLERLHLRDAQPIVVESRAMTGRLVDAPSGNLALGHDAVEASPLAQGRTTQSILALVPGITFTDSVGTLAQFTALGQRRFANRLTIDGVSADLAVDVTGPGLGRASGGTLPASGTSGGTQTLVPFGALEDIQVRTTNASPAFARAPGAQTAIVTRAGGDVLKGDAFAEGRPNALAAKTWFANAGREPRRDLHAFSAGATLGGSLLRDRLFGFAAFEQQRLNRPQYASMQVPSMEMRGASDLLASFPAPTGASAGNGLAPFSGRFRAKSTLRSGSARVDGALSPRQRLFARAQRGMSEGDELGPYLLHGRAFTQREATTTRSATIGWTQTFAATLHEMRANVTHHGGAITAEASEFGRPFDRQPFVGDADAWLSITLHADPGGGGILTNGAYAASRQQHVEVTDAWTAVTGRHTIQAGAEFRRTLTRATPPLDAVTLRYPNLQAFTVGAGPLALLDRHLPVAVLRHGAAAFAQDTLRLPRATLTFGARYSVTPAPRSANQWQPSLMVYDALPTMEARPAGSKLWRTAWGNVAPHVGLSVGLSPTTTARTGWSRAFDDNAGAGMLPYGRGYPYTSRRGIASAALPIALDSTTAPYAPDMLAEHYAYTDDFRPAHTDQWHVGLDRQFGSSHSASLMYVGSRGRDLPYWHVFYPLAPRQTTSVQAFSTDGRSSYHGLIGEFTQRLSRGAQARVTYTWGHSIDNDSGESERPLLPPSMAPPRSNTGNSDYDRRHHLRANVSFAVPESVLTTRWLSGARLDIIGTAIAGAPFSVMEDRAFQEGVYFVRLDAVASEPLWLADNNAPSGQRVNTAAFVSPTESRQGTLGRNQLRGRGMGQIDVALSRMFHLASRASVTLRVSAYNLLNSAAFGSPVGVYGEPTFGSPRQTYADALGTGTLTHGGLPPQQQVGGPRSVQGAIRLAF